MRPADQMRKEENQPGSSLPQNTRSHWIDFFKGVAILCILINHTEDLMGQPWVLSNFLFLQTGIVSDAEVFIFLSGLLMGYVYLPVLEINGFRATVNKATKRSLQLYYYHLLSLVITLLLIWFFLSWITSSPIPVRLEPFFSDPLPSLIRYATLTLFPGFFVILAIYIFFLMLTAVLLPLIQAKPLVSWAVALTLYFGSNLLNQMGYSGLVHPMGMFFNPFAWYFLFFIGVYLGVRKREGTLAIPTSKAVLYLAVALCAAIFINYKLVPLLNQFVLGLDPEPLFHLRGASRSNLGPVRLLNFLALALIAHRLVSPRTLSLRNVVIRGICFCGRFSLEVFALGLVLAYFNYYLYLTLGSSKAILVALEFGSVALSMALAFYMAARKDRPKLASVPRDAATSGP